MFAALSILIALIGAVLCLRQGRRSVAWRAGLLSQCAVLLQAPRLGRDRAGFATLDGTRDGAPVAVRLIPEALVHRRLPQLWLSVSLRRPLPTGATLDVLRRPAGAEFYAPADLPLRLLVPAHWPADTLMRGTAGAEAVLWRAEPILAAILADPRVKEVLVTPRGVRLVVQAAEGARGAYLLLRGSRFDLDGVAPALLDETLAGLDRLAHALSQNAEDIAHARAA